ncbi:MAG: hypothetical protein LLG24_00825 [Actinomycetia bacterium]|nr:hypothetical protein [Actinomycetes bacterium]
MTEQSEPLTIDGLDMSLPTVESVRYWIRDLDPVTEGFEVIRMTRRKGNIRESVSSLPALAIAMARAVRDLETPLLEEAFLNAGFNWVDSAKLVKWVRTVVGDEEMADVIESRLQGVGAEFAKMAVIESIVDYRFRQYTDVLSAVGEGVAVFEEIPAS